MRVETAPGLELWGGVECTVNRVRDDYHEQLDRSGHARRMDDLDRFAALGIRSLRFPVLWERLGEDDAGFRWADPRLARLAELGVRPIVGLVHHGSGPPGTSLVDPGFPERLAAYATRVAERYPAVTDFTPVNEPLTTARFSGLYGHWYPHGRSASTFVRALLTEVRATALSMRAIRRVSPAARLIQTEDTGRTWSTRPLAYQAEHDNDRRMLGLDLLFGRVDRYHPLWRYLLDAGASVGELMVFVDEPCPPDVIGLNYYVTSDRFLDHRLDRYPAWTHGGNGRDAYADVEAVRVLEPGLVGHRALLDATWRRYRTPLAITEAHLGGTREEQVRWLAEAWRGATLARDGGASVVAVTVWSLLGAFDWGTLVTCCKDLYEPGAYDIRSPAPRPTAIAAVARELGAGRQPEHPVLASPGWWRRDARLLYPTIRAHGAPPAPATPGDAHPLLITGATGTLGRAFARRCDARGLPYHLTSRREMDIADARAVRSALEHHRPWAVINAAGYVRVDDAEREPRRCRRENTLGAATLAEACAQLGVALGTFSSDLVFDGERRAPYVESHATAPLGVYGRSKAAAERLVLERHPASLVVRTSAFFGPWDDQSFVVAVLDTLASGRRFRAASDATVSPTYVPDLVDATLDLLVDGERGIWHLASAGAITWAELARRSAEAAGLDPDLVEGCATAALDLPARRPLYSVLRSERGWLLPSLDDALGRFFAEWSTAEDRKAA